MPHGVRGDRTGILTPQTTPKTEMPWNYLAETGVIQPQSNAAQEFLPSFHDQYQYE